MSTNLIVKERGAGKTTQLLYTSETTQYPILTQTKYAADSLLKMAAEIGLSIPTPITITDMRRRGQKMPENIIIDEGYNLIGEALDYYLGTHVVAVTFTDKLKEKYGEK
ncbi:MAG TPA: hypothetical protein DCW90_07545 [Lachnospiraceae bacterium]|nr:hypothetical protein [Lachnospiraceae bacterium]